MKLFYKRNVGATIRAPITGKPILKGFIRLKYQVARKITAFLQSKEIIEIKLVCRNSTFYSFGSDHGGGRYFG